MLAGMAYDVEGVVIGGVPLSGGLRYGGSSVSVYVCAAIAADEAYDAAFGVHVTAFSVVPVAVMEEGVAVSFVEPLAHMLLPTVVPNPRSNGCAQKIPYLSVDDAASVARRFGF